MRKMIRIAALAALTLVGVAQANAAVKNLAECYDLVIADCNKGDHAQSCASHGMDECDEVFPTPMTRNPGIVFGDAPGEVVRPNVVQQMGIAIIR